MGRGSYELEKASVAGSQLSAQMPAERQALRGRHGCTAHRGCRRCTLRGPSREGAGGGGGEDPAGTSFRGGSCRGPPTPHRLSPSSPGQCQRRGTLLRALCTESLRTLAHWVFGVQPSLLYSFRRLQAGSAQACMSRHSGSGRPGLGVRGHWAGCPSLTEG